MAGKRNHFYDRVNYSSCYIVCKLRDLIGIDVLKNLQFYPTGLQCQHIEHVLASFDCTK